MDASFHTALWYSTLAGLTIPVGGFIARIENIRPLWLEEEMRHAMVAFGAGALIAAIAFALVPEGIRHLNVGASAAAFASGAVLFMLVDRLLAAREGAAAQCMAMLMDFLPEAAALGAAFATGTPAGPLLAILIALQNLPEGFNAYREIRENSTYRPSSILVAFGVVALLGPLFAAIGHVYLAQFPQALGVLMLGCAGGILYLIFQDIAPQVPVKRAWTPPLGAVAGFMLGMIGFMLTGNSAH
jgi:ZIP family zinc transporter